MCKKILLLTISFIILSFSVNAEKFKFQYVKDDSYRILSTVHEDVIVNNELHHKAEIINRISVHVTDITPDGSGVHDVNFMTSENIVGAQVGTQHKVNSWGQEYNSIFTRNQQGYYTISDEYFMPVVRNVPIFPDRDLSIGDTWEEKGEEAHDLRQTFNINTPFKVPFTARYTYQGTKEENGIKLHVFKAVYNLYFINPEPENIPINEYFDYPISTMGYSDQTIYWDNDKGTIHSYTENFKIQLETVYGNVFVFKGTAGAEISELKRINNEATIAKVQEQIDNLGIQNTAVNSDEKGITISIENIQFKPDSAILEDSEKEKLQKIASILRTFTDNDLLISGHTALAGTQKARQELSEQRAQSVADFLVDLGVKDAQHIFTQGFGASKPIAPNTNSQGMSRNRRVEITIMEK